MALGCPILGGEAQLACEDALLDPSGAVTRPGTDQNVPACSLDGSYRQISVGPPASLRTSQQNVADRTP